MSPVEALVRWLTTHHATAQLVVVHDLGGLLEPWEETSGGWRPLLAETNLRFRLDWRTRGESGERHLIVRRRAEVFVADLEGRAQQSGVVLELTPRSLLALASGRDDWPAWLDREPLLVRECLGALVRLRRRLRGGEPAALEDLVARAALGFALDEPCEPAEAWQKLSERATLLPALAQRKSPLIVRLRDWLVRQPAPLCWLDPADPSAAQRLTWLVALLLPHLPQVAELLPRIYPGASRLEGCDPTAIARVAYRLARRQRKLAAAQQALAEGALSGPLRAAVTKHLQLESPAVAAAIVSREVWRDTRCAPLLLMACRVLLEAFVGGNLPPVATLEGDLDALLSRPDSVSDAAVRPHATAVRQHAQLLRSILRLERTRHRLAHAVPLATPEAHVRRALAWLVDTELASLPGDLATAARCLTRNSIAEPGWRPRPDTARHKVVLRGLYQLVQLGREALEQFQQSCAQAWPAAVAGGSAADGSGIFGAAAAWEAVLSGLLTERDRPNVTVVLVAGLPWHVWPQRLARPLAAVVDAHARAVAAAVPAAAGLSLRRTLAGARWRSEQRGLPWSRFLRLVRPELGLTTTRPPKAFEALAADGAVLHAARGGQLRLVVLDLLAGGSGGVAVATWEQRLEQLHAALVALARGRRDDAIVLLGTSGAARCGEAAGLALPGEVVAPRCLRVRRDEDPPEQVVAVCDGEAAWWLASGPERLAPAARELVMADGGLDLAELAVPMVLLTPVPAGERATLLVGELAVPDPLPAGAWGEAAVTCTLSGGALAEVATLSLEVPGTAACEVMLDLGEPRRLVVPFRLSLPHGVVRLDLTVEAEVRIGRRVFRRRAPVTVVAPLSQPAAAGERREDSPARRPNSPASRV